MSEEILINITPMESRVAVVENGVLQEVHVERTQRRGIVGNIYKGRVVRVLPGMQAAFVDIGLERAAFIHAAEISNREGSAVESISALVHEGQALVVQVTKDPIGTKGARLTTHLSIPSRYLVYMPRTSHVGISLRIEDEVERERLKKVVADCVAAEGIEGQGGFILRTAAEGAGEDEILADIRYLRRLWDQIAAQIQTVGAPSVIYEDLSLAIRTLRDLVNPRIEKIRIDSRENFQKITSFVEELMPEISDRLEHYPGERPIFDLYGVEDEIQKALERKVLLKSGGYLIVDPTEAMTTIDVNTGAFVGHRNLEETIFKTNLEAATAIARQLRLRNLGGIIIIDFIDFIDMEDEEHRRQVLRTLEKQLERDHAKTNIIGITELGLVQMTRKRTRESLVQILCEPCPCCQGRGMLKTAETTCYEIFREILREARAYQADSYLVLANQKVVDRLLDEESGNVADLEAFIGRTIKFQVEAMYSQEQYDVVLL
ncbi:TPA: ribonuclease G [Pseudomonas aeruginosa]|uniref:ribonuclease G n=3 Tax=Bacteria TaxID=2 RepID=UPI0020748C0B|nr:ribonuclease G [Pseudomonas aeruginosa]MCM6740370.1 ribonuclease G [Pseudomonas aeruginosa]MCQ9786104.1 ribonuclease G [Pseudomonas aeruginosa]HCE6605871.1 ribonuclease G [Pseudomonas aeruginosa]HCE9391557.1 ribonuclease G [Pseudomonas aeruginosa]HCI3961857.1 ribonuclease G [Pseudomonas aeruginosa]